MWYQILPVSGIIVAALSLPGYGLWWLHYATLGNHFRRSLLDRWERGQYQRDVRITGSAYVVNGLDAIPDK